MFKLCSIIALLLALSNCNYNPSSISNIEERRVELTVTCLNFPPSTNYLIDVTSKAYIEPSNSFIINRTTNSSLIVIKAYIASNKVINPNLEVADNLVTIFVGNPPNSFIELEIDWDILNYIPISKAS